MAGNGNSGDLPPLTEPVHCPDVFADGIARVERIGGECVRIVLYADTFNEQGEPVRVVVARLIRPISMLINAVNVLALTAVKPPRDTAGLH